MANPLLAGGQLQREARSRHYRSYALSARLDDLPMDLPAAVADLVCRL